MFNVLTHLKAFSIFMTLQILFVTYFSYLENCKRLKTWYQKIKITVASVQIIEENLFQWVHCKYLQGVIFAYFTHISLQLLLTFNWESEIHRFLSVNICSVLSHLFNVDTHSNEWLIYSPSSNKTWVLIQRFFRYLISFKFSFTSLMYTFFLFVA